MRPKIMFLTLLMALTGSSVASAREYLIQTRTCSVSDADNDESYIYLSVFGTANDVMDFHLNSGRNDFETGAVDAFSLKTASFGEVESVLVRIEGGDGWCFEWIKITDPKTGVFWKVTYESFIDGDSSWPSVVYCPVNDERKGMCSGQ
jgi:hypothetical protein